MPTLNDAQAQLVAFDDAVTVASNVKVDFGCLRIGHSALIDVVTSLVEMRLSMTWRVFAVNR